MVNLQKYFPSLLFYLIVSLWPLHLMAREVMIPIGVVLDLNSPIGSMANSCIWMAHHDFYKQHPRFQTRLDLRTRNSGGDTVKAAYAAFDLITKEKVKAIIGPQTSEQARHVINLGREHGVPIISSATSPSLSPARTPIFIRMAQNDSSQVKAIAAIVEAYGWREVVLIYENTEYGNGLVPHLIDALDVVDTKVPYRSVIDPIFEESHILEELENLKENSTRIFIVHMTGEHGSRFFSAVEKAGMMSEGYGWIVTEGLSVELDPSALERMDNMQGVLGVRTIARNNEKLDDFKKRWKALSVMENNIKYHTQHTHTITLFGLWAYDIVWALAMAVENATNYGKQSGSLVNAILATKFQGLSGYVDLKGGQLEQSVVEVFNVLGHKERIIGYWSPERGLFQDDQEKQKVRQPVWPGYTMDQPPKLRFGVPVRKGFTEFVKVETIFNTTEVSGFVVDVFLEVLKALPFSVSYEFVPLENYGALAGPIANKKSMKFDAGVGDVTIIYDRTNYINFTLPYLESVVSMVVSMKHDEKRNMWVFLKPLSWGLWLTSGAALVLIGFVVWFLEHRSNNTAFRGTPKQQLGIVFWFSFSTLVFAHRERLVSNWSRGLLIIWIFVVLIITQSYTASLTSMLTVESLRPEFIDIKEIKRNNYFVGYQNQSFVKTILINELGFNESQLKAYNSPKEYHEALSKGTNNGGVAAIFDESPYINVFLSKYNTGYATVGPFYKTNGLAFAFAPQSPLVPYFSRALLNVIEDKDKFEGIKNKYFSTRIGSKDQSTSILDSQGLTVNNFAGLFIITTIASFVSFTFYVFTFLYSQWSTLRSVIHYEQITIWSLVVQIVKHFDEIK